MAVMRTARSRRGQLGLRAVSAPVVERFQISQCPGDGGGSRRNAVRRPMAGPDFASRATAAIRPTTPLHAQLLQLQSTTTTRRTERIMDRTGPDGRALAPALPGKVPARCTTDCRSYQCRARASGPFTVNDRLSPTTFPARRRLTTAL